MSTTKDYIAYIVDQLGNSDKVHTRSMFGEYALYYDEKVVAFVCDDKVFIKINEYTENILGEDYQKGPAYKGSKDYFVLGDDVLEDSKKFLEIVKECAKGVKGKVKKQQNHI